MKTISVGISTQDYEAFRRAARAQGRPIAQLIREAMAFYRAERMVERTRLDNLPALVGHRPVRPLPARHQIYDEVFARRRARR
jgi:hypothetical protein